MLRRELCSSCLRHSHQHKECAHPVGLVCWRLNIRGGVSSGCALHGCGALTSTWDGNWLCMGQEDKTVVGASHGMPVAATDGALLGLLACFGPLRLEPLCLHVHWARAAQCIAESSGCDL